ASFVAPVSNCLPEELLVLTSLGARVLLHDPRRQALSSINVEIVRESLVRLCEQAILVARDNNDKRKPVIARQADDGGERECLSALDVADNEPCGGTHCVLRIQPGAQDLSRRVDERPLGGESQAASLGDTGSLLALCWSPPKPWSQGWA